MTIARLVEGRRRANGTTGAAQTPLPARPAPWDFDGTKGRAWPHLAQDESDVLNMVLSLSRPLCRDGVPS